ncbi:MAG: phosphatase PAP2 family protein [Methanomassiliicoccales archaeon]|nr:phosphatase PAP2 family protein [Methanomassiliicoccales archaeon]
MERKRGTMAKMLVMLAALGVISWLLLQLPGFVEADSNLFLGINSFYDPTTASILSAITFLGSVPMGLIWVAGLFVFRRRDLALYVLVAVLIEVAYVWITKELVNRPRPYEALPNVNYVAAQFGQSFPSGHAAGAFAVALVLGKRERWTLFPLIFVSVFVALARVYIGVHYPSDVICGAIAGAIIGYSVGKMDLAPVQAYFGQLEHRLLNRISKSAT